MFGYDHIRFYNTFLFKIFDSFSALYDSFLHTILQSFGSFVNTPEEFSGTRIVYLHLLQLLSASTKTKLESLYLKYSVTLWFVCVCSCFQRWKNASLSVTNILNLSQRWEDGRGDTRLDSKNFFQELLTSVLRKLFVLAFARLIIMITRARCYVW